MKYNPHIRTNETYYTALGKTRRSSGDFRQSDNMLERILQKVNPDDRDSIRQNIAKSDSEQDIMHNTIAFPKRKVDRRNTIQTVSTQSTTNAAPQEPNRDAAKRRNTLFIRSSTIRDAVQGNKEGGDILLPLPEENSPAFYEIDEPDYISSNPFLLSYSGVVDHIPFPDDTIYDTPNYRLFISGIKGANDIGKLHQYHIHAILTIGDNNTPIHYPLIQGGYGKVDLSDDQHARLGAILPDVSRFLNLQLSRGNVLVHCHAGVSRSCAAVAGFFMKQYGLNDEEAVELVRRGRECCQISDKLRKQLQGIRKLSPVRRRDITQQN